MNYWWVNHKQTFKAEVSGGYIWSPKRNKNNSYNKSYENMTKAVVGDLVFSYADTKVKAIGVVVEKYKEQPVPSEFGNKAELWNADGYLVHVQWEMLEHPFFPKEHLKEIASLLPEKHSPIQIKTGNGNQGIYLAAIGEDLGNKLIELINQNNNFIKPEIEEEVLQEEEEKEVENIEKADIPAQEKLQLIKARKGQGIYRSNLLKIEKSCRVTGITNISFLVASHIKPWCKSENAEKIDGNNGLLLSPHVDKLFDRGYISFADNGDMLIKKEAEEVFNAWGLVIRNVGSFNKRQSSYLAYHRESHGFL